VSIQRACLVALIWPALAVLGACEEAATEEAADITEARNPFDLAGVCAKTLGRHVSVRDTDLSEGTVRWNCADVPGITTNAEPRQGRGQEYCEYTPIQNGKRVETVAELTAGEPLYCYFTSVFQDVDGKTEEENPNEVPGARDKELAEALSAAMGVSIDPELARMKLSFNSRNAATTLISDCAAITPNVNEERQVACYQAATRASANDAATLKTLCRGRSLTSGDRWAKAQALGAKVLGPNDAGYQEQRDIIGCVALRRAENGGVTFRNSDPMICSRVFRAHQECGCKWESLPKEVEGFSFTGWTGDTMPTHCKRVEVDGAAYKQLLVCEVPAEEVAELELNLDYAEDLPKLCNERFAKDVVMKAPLRAVEVAGSCRTDTAFCKAFAGD